MVLDVAGGKPLG